MKRNILTALSAVLLTLTAACGNDSSGPLSPPMPTGATLRLKNNSNTNIVEVNFTLCSADTWGGNRMNAGEVIAPGAIRTWTVDPGCYDLRAYTSSKKGTWYDLSATAGGTLNLALSSAANELMSIGDVSPAKVR